MITEDYVLFEIAKLLKEKGFDKPCRARYDNNGSFHYEKYPIDASGAEMHNSILCPTIQMVMEWLREVHNIAIDTEWEHLWYAYVKPMTANPTEDDYYQYFSAKYKEAAEAAIKYCLSKITMATIKKEEYPIKDNGFEYLGKFYDCQFAIKRDIKMILQEAEISHKDTFDELYDRESLKVDKVRIFLDKEDKPIFGIIIYLIEYKDESWKRCACGGYYPFWEGNLMPHPYQESICW